MTVAEMAVLFKLELDKVDTLSQPNFLDSEIELIFNTSQDLLIAKKYSEFEVNQKRIDDLRTIVSTVPIVPTVVSSTVYSAALPSDYWFHLASSTTATGTICGVSTTITLVNRLFTFDRLYKALNHPFNQPNEKQALTLFAGNTVQIYVQNGITPTSLNLTYLRKPLRMSISATGVNSPVGFTNQCELPDHMHREVVAESVRRTLESVESVRYNSYRQERTE